MSKVCLATEPDQVATAYAIRSEVFVGEQGVPPDLELDDLDATADHFLAYDDAGRPVGAGRLVIEPPGFVGAPASTAPVGHLGRLAVLGAARGSGLGLALVAAIERRAVERGLRLVALSAQTQAIAFYERLGYAADGPEFDDAGLPHRWMTRELPLDAWSPSMRELPASEPSRIAHASEGPADTAPARPGTAS